MKKYKYSRKQIYDKLREVKWKMTVPEYFDLMQMIMSTVEPKKEKRFKYSEVPPLHLNTKYVPITPPVEPKKEHGEKKHSKDCICTNVLLE